MSKITELLERIWKYNAERAAALDYELVVLAVPKHPANVEAIASLDLGTVGELLVEFTKSRRLDEISSFQPSAAEAPDPPQASRSVDDPQAATDPSERPRADAAERREGAADAPAAADENQLAKDAMVLMEMRPVFEIAVPNAPPLRIWVDGRIDGPVDGVVTNRIPQLLSMYREVMNPLSEIYRKGRFGTL